MTPIQKAWDIFWKFKHIPEKLKDERIFQDNYAKQCALLTVSEMLNEYHNKCPKDSYEMERHLFWNEVKRELNKL